MSALVRSIPAASTIPSPPFSISTCRCPVVKPACETDGALRDSKPAASYHRLVDLLNDLWRRTLRTFARAASAPSPLDAFAPLHA
jgi:hypothetical protein